MYTVFMFLIRSDNRLLTANHLSLLSFPAHRQDTSQKYFDVPHEKFCTKPEPDVTSRNDY